MKQCTHSALLTEDEYFVGFGEDMKTKEIVTEYLMQPSSYLNVLSCAITKYNIAITKYNII